MGQNLAQQMRKTQRELHKSSTNIANDIIENIRKFMYDNANTSYKVFRTFKPDVYDILREAGFTVTENNNSICISWKDATKQKTDYKTHWCAYSILVEQKAIHDEYFKQAVDVCNKIKDKIKVSREMYITVDYIKEGAQKILKSLGYHVEELEEEYETLSGYDTRYYNRISW